jgi:vanillate O-demethylase monooxygenase subunit
MGNPARMPEYVAPLDTDWAFSHAWSVASGVLEMDGNYMQLHDNVLDLTHFGFIHIGSLGITDWIKPPKA